LGQIKRFIAEAEQNGIRIVKLSSLVQE